MSRKARIETEAPTSGPQFTQALFGHERALGEVSRRLRGGMPPQAWLITGPPGVGKATLAYRIARYLLRYGATTAGPEDLSVSPDDRVSHQIAAGSYPGLMVLQRRLDEKGRMPTVLGVDEIRRLESFFGMTSASGGWRVAIVDPADEMNDHAANAMLKLLEEPPSRSILLLLSHAPGKLLPTIRSRTQRLDLRPLERKSLDAALQHLLPDLSRADRDTLAELSEGSPGLALRLSDEESLRMARDAQGLLKDKTRPGMAALFALADRVARAEDGLGHFGSFLSAALARRIRERAQAAEGGLDRWVDLWERVNADYARAAEVHLEPRQTVLGSALAIKKLASSE